MDVIATFGFNFRSRCRIPHLFLGLQCPQPGDEVVGLDPVTQGAEE